MRSETDGHGHVDQTAELVRLCGMHGTFVKKKLEKDGDYGLAILSKEKPIALSKILMPGRAHTRCVEILEFRDYFVACSHIPLTDSLCEIAAEIVRLNLADRDKPVFFAGDLNSTPETKAVAILKKGFTVLSDVTQNTFPADAPRCCIDYIMVDTKHADMIEVISCRGNCHTRGYRPWCTCCESKIPPQIRLGGPAPIRQWRDGSGVIAHSDKEALSIR